MLPPARRTIGVKGNHIFPGILHSQAHPGWYVPFEDDLERESRAAVCGDVTTWGIHPMLLAIDVDHNLVGDPPEPCVWDRGELTHKVNQFDLQQKYCDVLEPGRFDAEFPAANDPWGAAR
jgi:hypothetical protein